MLRATASRATAASMMRSLPLYTRSTRVMHQSRMALSPTIEKLQKSELGQKSEYRAHYDPKLIFPILRQLKRDELDVSSSALPFSGHDVWKAYELSWLNNKGKPLVAIGTFTFPCSSTHIIESKSFKLYLNSFNNSKFACKGDVVKALCEDLSAGCGAECEVQVDLLSELETHRQAPARFDGVSLDELDISVDAYTVDPGLLAVDAGPEVDEVLHSDLLKSNCLVTSQPDWGSLQITYTGQRLSHEGLLKYIISFRNHEEFHEQCVERVFTDIMKRCQPQHLTVEARYTRRGGLDISPKRSTEAAPSRAFARLARQ